MSTCGVGSFDDVFYQFMTDGTVKKIEKTDNEYEYKNATVKEGDKNLSGIQQCVYAYNKMYFLKDGNLYNATSLKNKVFTVGNSTDLDGYSSILVASDKDCYHKLSTGWIESTCGNKTLGYDSASYEAVAATFETIYFMSGQKELTKMDLGTIDGSPITLSKPLDLDDSYKILLNGDTTLFAFALNSTKYFYFNLANSSLTPYEGYHTESISDALILNNELYFFTEKDGKYIYESTSLDPTPASSGSTSSSGVPRSTSTSTGNTPKNNSSKTSGGIAGGVAGGFTALGIAIGLLIALGIFFWRRNRRRNDKSDVGRSILADEKSQSISSKIPINESIYPQNYGPPPKKPFKVVNLSGPSIEANPMQTSVSPIFLDRCSVHNFGPAVPVTNLRISGNSYTRECIYNNKPALIHYIPSNNREKFTNMIKSLSAIEKFGDGKTTMLELLDAFEYDNASANDYKIQFIVVTSFYETNESLAGLYKRFKDGTTVVDVKDEVFIVCTVSSLIKSVRNLHRSGYVHRQLSMDAFYAESSAPSLTWILSDYDKAKQVLAKEDGKRQSTDFQKDIYDLGCILYTVISGGRHFQDNANRDLASTAIEDAIRGQKYSTQYRRILSAALNRDLNKIHTADGLVSIWDSFFDLEH